MITKQEFKERNGLLIADLRNPENKQTRGILRDNDGHCCLGRACEVYKQQTSSGEWEKEDGFTGRSGYAFIVDGDRRSGAVPLPVGDWFGWDSVNPTITSTYEYNYMAGLNDWLGFSFPKIAGHLETWVSKKLAEWPEENA